MKPTVFQRSALALAISGAALAPVQAWSDLLDGASDVLTLRDAPGEYEISGFDMVAFPGGSFVVVWTEHDASSNDKVFLQLFNKTGSAIGTARELAQASGTGESFEFPTVGGDLNGNLALAWTVTSDTGLNSLACNTTTSVNIRGLTLSPPYSSSQQLPLYSSQGNNPCSPEIAMDDDGDFVLVWATQNSGYDLSVQTYLAGGAPSRGQKALVVGMDSPAKVALQNNQTILFGWLDSNEVLGRKYDLQLNPLGGSFSLDGNENFGSEAFNNIDIANDVDGGFITTFTRGSDQSSNAIDQMVQRWNADGSEGSGRVVLSTTGSSMGVGSPSIASDSEGNIVTTWDYSKSSTEPSAAIEATSTNKSNQSVFESSSYIQDLDSDTTFHSARIAMNDDVIAIAWVPDDSSSATTINARILQPLSTNTSSDEDQEEGLFGSINPWFLALLGGLLGLWRRIRTR
ncbi:hypothetical protein [Saccharospirillum mangrovi]|uniref:hypothetical protein n=1 Tax=Saccharospirillum mangrovi TaxID=2161747 RepID=UPI000D3A9841|nr:hypothetical protein [Saccharospirillum mangrovi]